jgi:membrane associated rhomboid family serine protease
MKRAITLFIVSLIMGFVIFSFVYWLLKKEFYFSVNVGLSGAVGGLAAEFMRGYIDKRKGKNILEAKKNKY